MSTEHCFIEGCLNTKTSNDITFFPFPENELLHILWSQAIRTNKTHDKNSIICSKHFKNDDFVLDSENKVKSLMPDSVPSLYLFPSTPSKIKIKHEKLRHHVAPEFSSSSSDEYTNNAPTKEKLKRKIKLLKQKINRFESKFENIKLQLKEELTKRNLTETDAQSAMTLLSKKEFAYKFKHDNNSLVNKLPTTKSSSSSANQKINKQSSCTSSTSSGLASRSSESESNVEMSTDDDDDPINVKRNSLNIIKTTEKLINDDDDDNKNSIENQPQPSTSTNNLQMKLLQNSNDNLQQQQQQDIVTTTIIQQHIACSNNKLLLNSNNVNNKDEMELS